MQAYCIAILLAAVAIGASTANPYLVPGPSRMFEIMSATSEVQRNNPALATSCFIYYQDIFAEEYRKYREDYDGCLSKYESGKEGTLERYESYVWTLSNSTYNACEYLLKCDQSSNSLDSLSCYSVQGTNHSQVASGISYNASVYIGALTQEISLYEFTRDACTNEATRDYQVCSDKSYDEFQDCLAGLSPVPEPTSTTPGPESSPSTEVAYATRLARLFKHPA